ncbi:purine-cytosine permease family protein [Inhella gelatinilytica]|uniref:Cytosine permease n=1 Tax=Inhella gelatinilytica TaxID=2795030 RepID=A0A931ND13_9BURK|nr:cytosine permease [Inhella gelatinilytica]MBH9552602.1 cytosine permease [Inhella gelatinilytica]
MSGALAFETHSAEAIPAAERHARPLDLFRLLFGGCNTFATSVLGSFPVFVGLSVQDGLWALLLGLLAGSCALAPMSLFGPRNGTNDPVSSTAHFGVYGRLIGSGQLLLTAIVFFSLAVWSSGDALVGGAHALAGLPVNALTQSAAYTLMAAIVVAICIYGFQLMLWFNRVAVLATTLLFGVALMAFGSQIDLSYAGSVQRGDAGWWAAFVATATVAASNPLSFSATLGDWGRYVPLATPRRRLMAAVLLAQAATLLPLLFGLFTAAIMATTAPEVVATGDYMGGLIAISPAWFLLPLCLIALIGGIATGTTALYGTGLDLANLFTRHLNRARATLMVGLLAVAVIFVGRFVLNLVESVAAFAALIGAFSCPWLAVMVIGYWARRGHYLPDELQALSRRVRGGQYWFSRGWNLRALAAWTVGSTVGLLFAQVPGKFTGPLSAWAGGMDLSAPTSLLSGATVYLLLLWGYPESDQVQGPLGHGLRRHQDPRPQNRLPRHD